METPEEKVALLQLLGTLHGQAQQLDQYIVGESTNLRRGVSTNIKQQFEAVLKAPVQPKQEEVVFQPSAPEPIQVVNTLAGGSYPISIVPVPQPAPPSYAVPAPFQQDKLVAALENIHKVLEKLVNYLILKEDEKTEDLQSA